MPINVFGDSFSSYDNGKEIDINLFEQKPHLRTIYIESSIKEDLDLRNQFRIKNLPDPISIREAVSKNYVDNKFNDPSKKNDTTHVDFIDENLYNVDYIKVNSFPNHEEHLTPKYYVDNAVIYSVNASSFLRLDPNEKLKLDARGYKLLSSTLTSPKTIAELLSKSYIDYKFDNRSIIKNTAHVDFNDKSLHNVRFVKVNSMPGVEEHLVAKDYVDKAIFYSVKE